MKVEDEPDVFEEASPVADAPSLAQEMLRRVVRGRWTDAQIDAAVDVLEGRKLSFPAGKRSVSPGLTPAIQLVLLDLAALEAISTFGWSVVTVADITKAAKLSRRILYYHYEDKEDLFEQVLDKVVACLKNRVERAASSGESWSESLRLALEAALEFVVNEPHAARALIVESRSAGKHTGERYDELLEYFAQGIETLAREEIEGELPPLAAQAIVGGIVGVLYLRLSKGETIDPDGRLLRSLLFHAMTPYVGRTAALTELKALAPG